jgi:hypothetical protein
MTGLRVWVEGVGLWSPQLGDFAALRGVLSDMAKGESGRVDGGARGDPYPLLNPLPEGEEAKAKSALLHKSGPEASMLSSNVRRRAPESVRLAVEVAGQAVTMSGRDAATTACVFTSSYGDPVITDYMCDTLAHAPAQLSPTRFHNSVHNSPVGYWTIATGCHAPSTAVAAQRASFGAGLLEAVSQVLAEQQPVLLVCSDIAGSGPLVEVTLCREPFGCALVLAPEAGSSSMARLDLELVDEHIDTPLPEPLAGWREGNPAATSLALLTRIAHGAGSCRVAISAAHGMQIDVNGMERGQPE